MITGANTTNSNGSPAQAIVDIRPPILDVDLAANGNSGLPATIRRINAADPRVKLELESDWGDPILVEMEHPRLRTLGLATNARVYLSPRDNGVFVYDAD